MRPLNFLATIIIALLAAMPVLAADVLFELSGTNSKGEAVTVAMTRPAADEFGLTEIQTKLVSQGEDLHKVKGITVSGLIKRYDLVGVSLAIEALDGYSVDVPRSDIDSYPAVIGLEIDGKPISVRERGPAWLIYPVSGFKELDSPEFEARSVWQIKAIKVGSGSN